MDDELVEQKVHFYSYYVDISDLVRGIGSVDTPSTWEELGKAFALMLSAQQK